MISFVRIDLRLSTLLPSLASRVKQSVVCRQSIAASPTTQDETAGGAQRRQTGTLPRYRVPVRRGVVLWAETSLWCRSGPGKKAGMVVFCRPTTILGCDKSLTRTFSRIRHPSPGRDPMPLAKLFLVATLLVATLLVPAMFCCSAVPQTCAAELLPTGDDRDYADQIRQLVEAGIANGEMPGAVVVVAGPSQVFYARAFGHRQLQPSAIPMTLDTVFDLASLTKPIATATSVMKLVEQGKVELDAPISRYLPEFGQNQKDTITVSDLLLHVGGLIPDNALGDYDDGPEKAWERICQLMPIAPRGEKFAYTDVGFIVLGELVRRVGGQPLDRFAAQNIFQPLGMTDTTFNPNDELCRRAAATEMRDGQWLVGQVHDPRAFRLGGVAGHAGLFSTAADLVTFGQMMLGNGTRQSTTILNSDTVAVMTRAREIPRGTRTYGWDHRSPYSSNRGEGFSGAAFGHGGFTGTVLWIDQSQQRIFIFLSNRLHPDGKGSVNALAGKIATIIAQRAN